MMKQLLFAAALAAPAFSQTYTIDPAHSTAQFVVKHMMVTNVRGEFSKVEGTVVIDPKNPANSKVDAVIDATTVSTRDAQRDGHLKSPDFFDVAKYPTITFHSTKVVKQGATYLVTGDLSIRGVTKTAVLNVNGPTAEIKSPFGTTVAGATATTAVNRKDFGVSWNKALDNGGVMVSDDVAITLDIELTRK